MTDIPGTTRDLVTEVVDIDGAAITLVDTAGLHGAATDAVEQEGISRAHAARRVADLAIVVLDRSRPLDQDDRELLAATQSGPRLVLGNKSDVSAAWPIQTAGVDLLAVSAKSGRGIDELRRAILTALSGRDRLRDTPAVTNARHAELLSRAADALRRAAHAAEEQTAEEFVAADVSEARAMLEEVTGARTPDDVLHAIFSWFCIGK